MATPEALSIALLIDCDNARPASIRGILDELARHGSIHVRRAYGNWKQNSGWEEKLHPFAIQPVQQFPYTKGKNATDLAMAIDAMELLYTESLDAFALVTSDCDFTPLAMKIRTKGRKVFGFGETKTPVPFQDACSQFIWTDMFQELEPDEQEPKKPARMVAHQLRGDTRLMSAIRSAIKSSEGDDGWAFLGKVGHVIASQSPLSPRNYGYAKWAGLIRATECIEEEVRNQNQPHIRLKRPTET